MTWRHKLADWLSWKNLPFFCLAFVIGILPMIVYMNLVDYDEVFKTLFQKRGRGNFFTYYKSIWLLISVGSGLLWFALYKGVPENKFHSPIVLFSFFSMLSSVFSSHPRMAWFGDSERFEGFFSLVSYLGLMFLFMHLVSTAKKIKFFVLIMLIFASIISTIGLLQVFGYDYFTSGFSERFLMPEGTEHLVRPRPEDMAGGNIITFGNTNYTGCYMGMLYALTLILFLSFGSIFRRIFLGILSQMILVNLVASGSRAGLYGMLVVVVFCLLLLRKRIRKNLIPFLILLISSFFVLLFCAKFATKVSQANFSYIFKKNFVVKNSRPGRFYDLVLEGDSFSVNFDGYALKVKYSNKELIFLDPMNRTINYRLLEKKRAEFLLKENFRERFEDLQKSKSAADKRFSINDKDPVLIVLDPDSGCGIEIFAWLDESILQIKKEQTTFFVRHTDKGFKFLSPNGLPVNLPIIENWGFDGWESFASSRGYIWSRSFPLLKKTFFIGFGPDNFAAVFPNNDYIGKLRHLPDGVFRIVDKPHNFYLQTAINTGILSLLSLVYLFFLYFCDSFSVFWNSDFVAYDEFLALALFAGVMTYLIIVFFNDSMVSVAPVFWAILGLGISLNRILLAENVKNSLDLRSG